MEYSGRVKALTEEKHRLAEGNALTSEQKAQETAHENEAVKASVTSQWYGGLKAYVTAEGGVTSKARTASCGITAVGRASAVGGAPNTAMRFPLCALASMFGTAEVCMAVFTSFCLLSDLSQHSSGHQWRLLTSAENEAILANKGGDSYAKAVHAALESNLLPTETLCDRKHPRDFT